METMAVVKLTMLSIAAVILLTIVVLVVVSHLKGDSTATTTGKPVITTATTKPATTTTNLESEVETSSSDENLNNEPILVSTDGDIKALQTQISTLESTISEANNQKNITIEEINKLNNKNYLTSLSRGVILARLLKDKTARSEAGSSSTSAGDDYQKVLSTQLSNVSEKTAICIEMLHIEAGIAKDNDSINILTKNIDDLITNYIKEATDRDNEYRSPFDTMNKLNTDLKELQKIMKENGEKLANADSYIGTLIVKQGLLATEGMKQAAGELSSAQQMDTASQRAGGFISTVSSINNEALAKLRSISNSINMELKTLADPNIVHSSLNVNEVIDSLADACKNLCIVNDLASMNTENIDVSKIDALQVKISSYNDDLNSYYMINSEHQAMMAILNNLKAESVSDENGVVSKSKCIAKIDNVKAFVDGKIDQSNNNTIVLTAMLQNLLTNLNSMTIGVAKATKLYADAKLEAAKKSGELKVAYTKATLIYDNIKDYMIRVERKIDDVLEQLSDNREAVLNLMEMIKNDNDDIFNNLNALKARVEAGMNELEALNKKQLAIDQANKIIMLEYDENIKNNTTAIIYQQLNMLRKQYENQTEDELRKLNSDMERALETDGKKLEELANKVASYENTITDSATQLTNLNTQLSSLKKPSQPSISSS